MKAKEKLDRAQKVAERVHEATVSLAIENGVFHGIEDTLKENSLNSYALPALDTMRLALIHSTVILLRALYNDGNQGDDASFYVMERSAQDSSIINALIEKTCDRYTGPIRAEDYRERVVNRYQNSIAEFLAAMASIDTVKRRKIKFFCGKKIAHITIRMDIEAPLLKDLWSMAENVIEIDRLTQFAFCQTHVDVRPFRDQYYASGVRLTKALIESAKPTQPSP